MASMLDRPVSVALWRRDGEIIVRVRSRAAMMWAIGSIAPEEKLIDTARRAIRVAIPGQRRGRFQPSANQAAVIAETNSAM